MKLPKSRKVVFSKPIWRAKDLNIFFLINLPQYEPFLQTKVSQYILVNLGWVSNNPLPSARLSTDKTQTRTEKTGKRGQRKKG